VRDELAYDATGTRSDAAKALGFIGGKLPIPHGPMEGEESLKSNLDKLREMTIKVGDDFWLMYDCWMSLDVNYATRLAIGAEENGLKWIEEALAPDDYGATRTSAARSPKVCASPPVSTRPRVGVSVCCWRWVAATSSSRTLAGAAASRS
jgi:L-alanine-DL-glutamate epimerase-like enolase superfamily enzyme